MRFGKEMRKGRQNIKALKVASFIYERVRPCVSPVRVADNKNPQSELV